jgi:hypothetical protein
MKWKEFFKPTKGKIITVFAIFLILYALNFFYPYIILSSFYRILTLGKIEVLGNFYIVLNYIVNPSYPAFQYVSINNFIIDLVNLPLLLLYWYLLSCLIFWIYDKVKRK